MTATAEQTTHLSHELVAPAPHSWRTRFAMAPTVLAGAAIFSLAYELTAFSFLIPLFLLAVVRLSNCRTPRGAFYSAFSLGMLCYAPQLFFFLHIFGAAAIPLWMILSVWLALFVLFVRAARLTFTRPIALAFLPILWTGLEFFRSELYYLRFTWLTPGLAFFNSTGLTSLHLGVYGIGFLLMIGVAITLAFQRTQRLIAIALLLAITAILAHLPTPPVAITAPNSPRVVGIQIEYASNDEIVTALDNALKAHPDTNLFVLSEFTFPIPVPQDIKDWCATNRRYLLLGAVDAPAGPENKFHNTAFVIDPAGLICFSQVKSVPVQFFPDGQPATSQHVWESPWGKIGVGLCYDLSYSRIVDELVRQGAVALIFPTMDAENWGAHEHALHGRIAPTRAAEYGIPIFRLCSSGISQLALPNGTIEASAPYPGQRELLVGTLPMNAHPSLPYDRLLVRACALLSIAVLAFLLLHRLAVRFFIHRSPTH